MNESYMLYQAEHFRTPREQLEEDIRRGEMAAALRQLRRDLTRWLLPASLRHSQVAPRKIPPPMATFG